jgi:hypothetical protein
MKKSIGSFLTMTGLIVLLSIELQRFYKLHNQADWISKGQAFWVPDSTLVIMDMDILVPEV